MMKNRKLRCFLVEDEDIDRISRCITNHPRLELVGTSINLKDVSNSIRNERIDILFLDNELGKGEDTLRNRGLEFLEILRNVNADIIPHVVAVSQYPDTDTQKALSLGVWDVIPKPFSEDTFNERIKRVIEDIDIKEKLSHFTNRRELFPEGGISVKHTGTSQKFTMIDLRDILYIKAEEQILKIRINGSNDIVETWTKNFETLTGFYFNILNSEQRKFFSQIHRSYIINVCYITEIEANKDMRLKGVEELIPIGSSKFKNETMGKWKAVFQEQ